MSTQPEIADDPCKDVKYKEPTVDSMRAQKDEVHPIHIQFFTDRNWSSVAHTVHTLSDSVALFNEHTPWAYMYVQSFSIVSA